ncbi:MAG TPA: hypothetical protein DDX39_11045 [Bacteroidales bacterium]|nr:hypothetical protein [Bacteroidales bacterium]
MRKQITFLGALLFVIAMVCGKTTFAQVDESVKIVKPTEVIEGVFLGETQPLKSYAKIKDWEKFEQERELAKIERNKIKTQLNQERLNVGLKTRSYPYADIAEPRGDDPVWQKAQRALNVAPIISQNFGGPSTTALPPDCNGAAGPNHYMQTINTTYSIYSKTGALLAGPTDLNDVFGTITGSTCNDGDPIVLYDEFADRWFYSEFSLCGTNDYMLIAVSTTNDPTGTWYSYSFDVADVPDYMKFGIWQDGYYMATNNSSGNDVYVFQRDVMLTGGASPKMVGFDNSWRPTTVDGFHCIMPLDNDITFAATGEPGMFITINDDAIGGGSDQIWIYELDVDWTTTSNSTFTRVQQLAVPAFDSNFGTDWANIAQQGTTQQIDAIPQIFMFRAQYINFGGYQTIMCTHTVDVDATDHAGVRWYELRSTGGTWSIRQSGTYAPDAHSRWMAGISMNQKNEIAIGYSISSSTLYPGIRIAGQSASEYASASGVLDIDETVVKAGTASQASYDRWGDYAQMSIDPSDNETFWFTTEYGLSASYTKGTQIVAFKFPDLALPPTTDFVGYPRMLLPGDNVDFSDLSTGVVDSWDWTFDGGSPATSSVQNPSNIVYSTPGTYDVILVATNTNGSNPNVKYGYIQVLDDATEVCDTVSQFCCTPSAYTSTGGYVGGTNEYGCTGIAEGFTASAYYPFNKVTGGRFYWAQATGSSSTISFNIWRDNGSGMPGDVIATKTMPLSDIVTDFNTDGYTDIVFDADVILPAGSYFIGCSVPNAISGDTLAILTNDDADSGDDTGYSLYGTSWETYSAWSMTLQNTIFPVMCYDPNLAPVAAFTGTPTTIFEGNSVTFTDDSYGSTATSWNWTFTGGTPSSYVGQTPPAITYSTAGTYAVSLTVSNANGSDTETKTDYITVNDPSVPICETLNYPFAYTKKTYLATGYASGNNGAGDKAKAEYFSAAAFSPYQEITGATISFGVAEDAGTASTLTVAVWNDNNGVPGTIIGSKAISYATVMSDVAGGLETTVTFDSPIPVTGDFYLGVVLPTTTGDSIAIYTNSVNESTPNTGWSQLTDNTWADYPTKYGVTLAHAIHPTMCTVPSQLPIADFVGSPLTIAPGETVQFATQAIGAASISWSFPGGTPSTSTDPSPVVTYPSIGLYNVSLTATNAAGADMETKVSYIKVTICQDVQLDIVCDQYATETTWELLDATSTVISSGGPYTTANETDQVNWCLDEQCYTFNIYDSYGDGMCCTYGNGSYTITNNATSTEIATGAPTTATATENFCIALPAQAPIAAFNSNTQTSCLGNTINFIDASAAAPTSWSWTFEGGTPATSTAQNPSVTYASAGTFNVSLTVSNASGSDTQSSTDYITIGSAPTISFTTTSETSVGACDGSATANVSGTSPYSYEWDILNVPGTETFSGATGAYNESATTNFTAAVSGLGNLDGTNYSVNKVCLDISQDRASDLDLYLLSPTGTNVELSTDNGGTVDNYSNVCFIMSAATAIEGVTTALSGDYRPSVTFANFHTGQNPNGNWTLRVTEDAATGNGGNTLNSWSIEFNTMTGQISQTVTDLCSGTYNVTATDANSCVVSSPVDITVGGTAPVADFSANDVSICKGSSVNFTDESTNTPTSWSWSFEGGTPATSTTQNPTVSYATAGTYDVTLQVTNADGTDTKTVTNYITVNQATTPTITAGGATTFCDGGSVTLTSSAASGYLWSTGATTQSITASASGSYTVQITDANGCTATSAATTVTENVATTPTITAGGSTTFCDGGSVTLTSSAASGYSWSTGATTQSITASATGNYTVQITDGNGCTATSAATAVTENVATTPTIANGSSTTFCAGGSVTLTSSAASGYSWSTGATTQAITVSTAGSYTVQITDGNGCTATSAAKVVTVNTATTPTITAGGATTFCDGGSVTLTSSAASGYSWSTGATTQSITASATGNYTVQITDGNGCTATSAATAVTENVATTPTITAGGPTSFCDGGSVTLTSSAASGYVWSTGATTQSITASATGSYIVQITDGNGCTATSAATAVTENVATTPTITNGTSTTFCAGGSVTLTSSAASGYSWSTGATTQAITVSTAGSYTVQITDANGCNATSAAKVVTVNTATTPTVTAGGPTTFCTGGSVTLTSSAASGYSWSTGATTQAITVSTAGSYTVQITDGNGCNATSVAKVVTVNTATTPTIAAGGPTSFCTGGSVTLTSSAASGYSWSTGATTQAITVPSAGNYTVQITDGNGCIATSAATAVTVNTATAPIITAGGPTSFCTGGDVTLTSSLASGYNWSTGATTQAITVSSTGNYSVVITDANGCNATSNTISVSVSGAPAPTITAGGATTFCDGGSVVLTSSPADAYTWSTGETTQAITVSATGSYTVNVTNTDACDGTGLSLATAVTANVATTPTISAGSATTFCNGGSVVLTSSAATGNLWSSGQTTQAITVSSAGGYSVIATDGNGCSATSASTTVTVNTATIPTILASGSTNICDGESVDLTSSAASGFLWSNGEVTQTITVSTADNYSVQITDGNGCNANSVVTIVNVNTPIVPTITAGGTTTFCAGGSVELTSSAASGYNWSNGAITQTITVTSADNYSVEITDGNGCNATSAPTTVTVNTAVVPTISAGGATTFCNGGSVVLTSSSATDNNWSSGATTQSITASAAGNYTVTAIDGNGCSATSSPTSVTVNTATIPTISTSGSTNICDGESVDLTSSVASGYAWSNGETTQTITVSSADNYTVQITDGNGCTAISSVTIVNVNTPTVPTITAGSATTFCDGGSVTLTSSAASGYSWSNGETTQEITVSSADNYTVEITDANGCNATSLATTVSVNTPIVPTISAGGATTFCNGSSVVLTSSSATDNTWSNGATSQSITASSAGNYTVTAIDGNGCSATSIATVISVNNATTPIITPEGPTSFCLGGSVTLTSSLANGYNWSNGETTQSIIVSDAGSYTVQITDGNGCNATSAAQTVDVSTAPIPTIIAGGATTFCDGESVTLTSSIAESYTWSNGETSQSIVVTTTGDYFVNVTNTNVCDGNGQSATTSVVVSIPAVPTILASGSTNICEGASVTLTSSAADVYNWSTGESTQSIIVDVADDYTVETTDGNGCSATSLVTTVDVIALPVINLVTDTMVCADASITLDAGAGAGYTYSWSNGTVDQTVTIDSVNVGLNTITVTVDVATAEGCTSSESIDITFSVCDDVISVISHPANVTVYPNPNNGVFDIKVSSIENEDVTIKVTNINGQLVYTKQISKSTKDIKTSVDISRFAKGVYNVGVNNVNKTVIYK